MINIKNIVRNRYIIPALCSLISVAHAQTWSNLNELSKDNTSHTLQLDKTDENPLRGFILGGFDNEVSGKFNYSVERRYINFDDAFNTTNDTLKSTLNDKINLTTAKGAHCVVRVICFYPGSNPFKWSTAPRKTVQDSNGNNVEEIDWNHATTMDKLVKFIKAFGLQYRDDERIAMVELGLYGNWGEWNVSNGSQNEMSLANRQLLVNEYKAAFTRTGQDKFMAIRYVTALSASPNTLAATMDPVLSNLGIYDDSFSYQTIGNAANRTAGLGQIWNTAQAIYNTKTTTTYRTAPRAGEFKPETSEGHIELVGGTKKRSCYRIFEKWPNHSKDTFYTINGSSSAVVGKDEDLIKSINSIQASWMGAHALFTGKVKTGETSTGSAIESDLTLAEYTNARKACKYLGYQLVIPQIFVTRTASTTADVGVKIKNIGIAPFYFDWQVEFIGKTSTEEKVLTFSKDAGNTWNLKEAVAQEGTTVVTKEFRGKLTGLPSGACAVLMRYKNPLLALNNSARSLRFMNQEQDTQKDGWMTLVTSLASFSSGGGTTPLLANGIYTIKKSTGELFVANGVDVPITFGSTSGNSVKWQITNQPILNQVTIGSLNHPEPLTSPVLYKLLEVDQVTPANYLNGSKLNIAGDSWPRPHSTWTVSKVGSWYRFTLVASPSPLKAMDAWNKSATENIVHLWDDVPTNPNQQFTLTLTN
jgi:hypothetical protein